MALNAFPFGRSERRILASSSNSRVSSVVGVSTPLINIGSTPARRYSSSLGGHKNVNENVSASTSVHWEDKHVQSFGYRQLLSDSYPTPKCAAIFPDVLNLKHFVACQVGQFKFRGISSKHSNSQFLLLTPPQFVLIILGRLGPVLRMYTFHLSKSPFNLLSRAKRARSK